MELTKSWMIFRSNNASHELSIGAPKNSTTAPNSLPSLTFLTFQTPHLILRSFSLLDMYPHVSREINGQPILVGLVKPEASLHRAVAANNLRRLQSSTVRVVAASNWSQMENYMIEAKPLPACPQGRLGTWLHIQWGQARSPSIRVDLLPPPQVSDSLAIHIHRQSHNHLLCLYNSVDIFFSMWNSQNHENKSKKRCRCLASVLFGNVHGFQLPGKFWAGGSHIACLHIHKIT